MPGNFNISIHEPVSVAPTGSSSSILVHYSVKIDKTYSTNVTVPNGSVFLDVMQEAQKINKNEFRYVCTSPKVKSFSVIFERLSKTTPIHEHKVHLKHLLISTFIVIYISFTSHGRG